MTNNTRLLIRNFAEQYLQDKVFNFSEQADSFFPIDINSVITDLNGIIKEDITDLSSDGYIQYTDAPPLDFEIHIRNISDERRKRFTLAHELGHLFLHMDFFDIEKRKQHKVYQDCRFYRKEGNYTEEELQTNEFAASFLMPSKKFIEVATRSLIENGAAYDVNRISDFFGVSNLAAITRGRWLGVFAWDNTY